MGPGMNDNSPNIAADVIATKKKSEPSTNFRPMNEPL